MSLEDAEILRGTTMSSTTEGICMASFTLPDDTVFQGEFESADQLRKLGGDWCASVRGHWNNKQKAKQKDRPPRVEKKEEKATEFDFKEQCLREYDILAAKIPRLEEDLADCKSYKEELEPLVKKWRQ